MTPFERGWLAAIALWRSGLTWESITHRAETHWQDRAESYSRGMVAACECMAGWHDVGRREARMHGIASEIVERLVSATVLT